MLLENTVIRLRVHENVLLQVLHLDQNEEFVHPTRLEGQLDDQ